MAPRPTLTIPTGLGCNVGRTMPLGKLRTCTAPRWARATRECPCCHGDGKVAHRLARVETWREDVECPECEGAGTIPQIPFADPLFRLAYERRLVIRSRGHEYAVRNYDEERRVAFHPVRLPVARVAVALQVAA